MRGKREIASMVNSGVMPTLPPPMSGHPGSLVVHQSVGFHDQRAMLSEYRHT